MSNLEEVRREALAMVRKMRKRFQEVQKRKVRDLAIGAITSDDPVDWDPEVRKAKAALLEAKSLLGMGPPSLWIEMVARCEKKLEEAVERAKERQNENKKEE